MKLYVGPQSTHNVVYVNRLDQLNHAYNVMKKIKSRHLPVVDGHGQVIGMLSDRDLLRAMKKPLDTDWTAVPANPEFSSEEIVQEYMSWPIFTVDESAPLAQAAQLMIDRKISALVVTKDHSAVGILTSDDLLKAFINDHKSSLNEVKNKIYGAIYSSPVGSIIQSLSNAGI